MKFTAGNLVGTVLSTLGSQRPISVIVDDDGSVFAGTMSGVQRWVPGSSNATSVISSLYWSVRQIRMDSYGNLYVGCFSMVNVYKYNITSNNC